MRLPKGKIYMRRFSIVISAAVVFVIAVGIIAKLWIIPAIIKKGITSEINKSWSGRVDVKGVKFSFRGRVNLAELRLEDTQGKSSLRLKNTTAFLLDILRLNFKVKDLEIAYAKIDLFPSSVRPEAKSGYFLNNFTCLDRGYFAIEQLNIEDISIELHGTKDKSAIYDHLQLSINKSQNLYNILLSEPSALDTQIFSLKGISELSTSNSNFELSLKTLLKHKDVSVLLSFLDINNPLYSTEGSVNMSTRFRLNPQEPDLINLDGAIDFNNWQILREDNLLLQNLCAKATLNSNQCKLEDIRADICQDNLEGSLAINNWMKRNDSSYTGWVSGKKVDLSELSKCLELPQRLSKGILSFEYNTVKDVNSLKELTGECIFFIDDSDLYQLPVINQVFTSLGLKGYDFQKATDAMVFFRNTGPTVTIDKGQVANRFWAIRVEPGGTIDLQNKTVDMHMIVIPISKIEDIIRKLPFAELFGKLKDKLTRLKVKGKWSDPASKLITKEPLTDVKEATVGFVRDVVNTSGQITETMREPFKKMMNRETE